ncbi:uncharacterized protein [Pseudorasbora parva]|uniref:uncharacterized protein n=1 Tax=Pseudorasbora parva TaxID=51549 RepID=UPI00351F5212
MGLHSYRSVRVPMLTAVHCRKCQQWVHEQQNMTMEKWKKVACGIMRHKEKIIQEWFEEHNELEEDSHPLKVEGTLRTSLSSLDRPRSRDSRSTLGGVDSLGRPAIFNTSRRGRDKLMERSDRESTRMMMMESYEEDSNMSQETQLLPPLHPSSYSMEQPNEIIRSRNGNAILPAEGTPRSGGSSRAGSRGHHSPLVSMYPTLTDEEEEDSVSPADSGVHRGLTEHDGFENGSSETASSQISEALSNHFERANGTLRPKSKPNNILLPANAKLFLTPHSPTIHKAQIV